MTFTPGSLVRLPDLTLLLFLASCGEDVVVCDLSGDAAARDDCPGRFTPSAVWLDFGDLEARLTAGGPATFEVRFAPAGPGTFEATSRGRGATSLTVHMRGSGVPPP